MNIDAVLDDHLEVVESVLGLAPCQGREGGVRRLHVFLPHRLAQHFAAGASLRQSTRLDRLE